MNRHARTPRPIPPLSTEEQERFRQKVDVRGPDECWPWLASTDINGRGKFAVRRIIYRAPRIAYILAYGTIPDGLHVLHTCDDPGCVNPRHLVLGTQADNVADMCRKGRHRSVRGESNGNAKLTESLVRDIWQLCVSGVAQHEIARRFGISVRTVRHVKSGNCWRHLQLGVHR